jgi:hypothetical protein
MCRISRQFRIWATYTGNALIHRRDNSGASEFDPGANERADNLSADYLSWNGLRGSLDLTLSQQPNGPHQEEAGADSISRSRRTQISRDKRNALIVMTWFAKTFVRYGCQF